MMNCIYTVLLGVVWASNVTAQFTEAKLIASDRDANDYFGISVSLSGNHALVGAWGDDDNGTSSGSAYIFHYDGSNWVEQTKLLPSDGAEGDVFGGSVFLSGDYAIIGAVGDDDNGEVSGSVYIFHHDGSNWVEQTKLVASDGVEYGSFGGSVSLSGNYALIGAYADDDNGDGSGSAYVFHYDGSNWVEQTKLLASDGTGGDSFGYSVSLSGDYALVSAPYDDDNGDGAGSAYIFHHDGSNWVEQAKLIASDGAARDWFGGSVSLSGDYAIIGAYANGHYSGSAYVFHYDGSNWVEQTRLVASDGVEDDFFGSSVSLSGDYALIGASSDGDNGSSSGSAYIFHYDGLNWVEQAKLLPSDGDEYDAFGGSVSLSGDRVLIGAPMDDDNGDASGSAYVYGGIVPPVSIDLTISPRSGGGIFQYSIELTNSRDASQAIDFWTELVDPDGSRKEGKVMTGRTLRSQRSYTESGTATLKVNAQPGAYEFVVKVDSHPDLIIATASETYTLTSQRKDYPSLTGAAPGAFRLLQNYPDPFNPSTTIRYNLSQDSEVTIKVYNALGQLVTTLVDDMQPAGQKSVVWNGTNDAGARVSSGIYILRMRAGNFVETKRMMLMK